ncbi:MAG: TCP-1/cpn60 chaperonin family protein, partial [Candidatus Liptonbacteria bacterium]
HDYNTVEEAAKAILMHAMSAPLAAIIENSGESNGKIEELARKKMESKDKWLGFNAVTNQISNLKEGGIIDPLKVTKTAFMNALSVASTYLMIGAAITEIPKKEEEKSGGMSGMGGGMDY